LRYQIDIDGRANELLIEENERRGSRSKADIFEEALIFYLEDMDTIEANIQENITSQMNLLCRVKIEKDKQAERNRPIVRELTKVEKQIEEHRLRREAEATK